MTSEAHYLDRARVLLSTQRALLMAVTPEMRAIDVSWNDCEIRLRFTLDRVGDYDTRELTNEVEAEIEADFLPEARVSSEVQYLTHGPVPLFDAFHACCARVYARRETM